MMRTSTRGSLRLAAAGSVLALALAACGGSDETTTSETESPDAVAKALLVSLARGDIDQVCERMTSDLIATTEQEAGAPCEKAFSFTENNASDENVEVAEAGTYTTIEETDATATVDGQTSEGSLSIELEKVDGAWLVDELGPGDGGGGAASAG